MTYKIKINSEDREILRFSHQAMATIFEIFLFEEKDEYAAQAANSAFNELDRLEEELSFFLQNSDISRINNLSQNEIITVGADTFDCLKHCMMLYQKTKGAFDISIRPLLELWKMYDYPAHQPSEKDVSLAVSKTGLPWLHIMEDTHQVCLMNKSIQIDLGGFGKGYAIDVLKKHLDDWDIRSGLIHSGQSTVSCFGKNVHDIKWPLSIRNPKNSDEILKKIEFTDGALSGSGLQKGQHIIDPRTGIPVKDTLAAWALTTEAGEADALSTAFMVMTPDEIDAYCSKYLVSALTIHDDVDNTVHCYGKWAD